LDANSELKLESIEKTIESGFIALVAIATQTREGKTGEPTNLELLEAKHLLNEIYRGVAG